jgi:hypothetical protein
MRNKTRNTDFCYIYGVYIVMAALLTALITFNIILYLNVNELQNKVSTQKKTYTAAEKILNSENQIRKETSVHKIEKELKADLNHLKSNFEILKSEISKSVNENKIESNFNIATIRNETALMSKKLNDFILLRSGIQNNVHVSKLTTSGFMYVYNKPYHNATKVSEMEAIKASCLPTTILCLGGRHIVDDVLVVVSCGSCFVVLTKTEKNTPNFNNGAYWYYSPNVEKSRSMGFAPSSKILQDNADRFDLGNNQRVSWQLDNVSNGYRLGSMIDLDIFRYYKVILKKDF